MLTQRYKDWTRVCAQWNRTSLSQIAAHLASTSEYLHPNTRAACHLFDLHWLPGWIRTPSFISIDSMWLLCSTDFASLTHNINTLLLIWLCAAVPVWGIGTLVFLFCMILGFTALLLPSCGWLQKNMKVHPRLIVITTIHLLCKI